MVQIIPAILTNNPNEVEEKIRLLEEVRVADPKLCRRIQIDIIDGVFADNKTVLPDALEEIETRLLIDFQLMTKEPVDWVERCVKGFADRIFGHIEMMGEQQEFVGKVQEVGAKVGLALDLDTPVSALERILLTNVDGILVMSTKAGFGSQEFDTRVVKKIRELDEIRARDDTPFRICVDGGINPRNIKNVVAAGADEVAVGARLFEGALEENIKKLMEAAYE